VKTSNYLVLLLAIVLTLFAAESALAATKTFYADGKVQSETVYNGDKKEQVNWYDTTGTLQSTERFLDPKTKIVTFYNAQGLKSTEETRVDDALTQLRTFYPMPGDKVSAETTYAGDNVKENRFYDQNGKLQSAETFVDAKTRLVTFHNAKGEKTSEETHVDGKLVKMRTFYTNGNTESEYSLNNGVLDGKYLLYFDNGKLKAEYDYKNGKQI